MFWSGGDTGERREGQVRDDQLAGDSAKAVGAALTNDLPAPAAQLGIGVASPASGDSSYPSTRPSDSPTVDPDHFRRHPHQKFLVPTSTSDTITDQEAAGLKSGGERQQPELGRRHNEKDTRWL